MAATTFVFCESQNAAVNIGAQVGSLWESNIGAGIVWPTKRLRVPPGPGNANQNHQTTIGTGVNPNDILYGQFMSDAIPAQTISGTVNGNIVIREGNTADNIFTQVGIFVVDSSGALLATLLNGTGTGGSEANSPSANNRNMPRNGSVAITPYTSTTGTDRIVVEIGLRTESTRTTAVGYMYFGDGSGTLLPSGDASDSSTTKSPWIQFSADIFNPPAGGGARSSVAVAMGFHDRDDDSGLFLPDGYRSRRSGLIVPGWRA